MNAWTDARAETVWLNDTEWQVRWLDELDRDEKARVFRSIALLADEDPALTSARNFAMGLEQRLNEVREMVDALVDGPRRRALIALIDAPLAVVQ